MATNHSSPESTPQKRQRRIKQNPQFVFDNTTTDKTPILNKSKPNAIHPTEDNTTSVDLYEPGDIVWSKLGSFPWWPALIYRCDAEGEIYTKTFNSHYKTQRQYFVYFYGKYLEYAWLSTRSLLEYAGLNNFIENAETAVQQASTKSEQLALANRYQLKVSMKKRVQWDEAIELADHALTMTKDERIQEFKDLLNGVQHNKKQTKNDIRRRKASVDETIPNKRRARVSLSSAVSSELLAETNTAEKSSEASVSLQTQDETIQLNNQKKEDEQPLKKKRGRKPKLDLSTLKTTAATTTNHSVRTRMNQLKSSSNGHDISSSLTNANQQIEKIINNTEIEYDYPRLSNNQQTSFPLIHLIQAKIPPLSNYEQKQIVESLLHHPNEKTLTFNEAQTFANNKAIEIVNENYHYQLDDISPEWFFDSILLKYPSIVFKYRLWFEHINPDIIPNETDIINLKQWQIALMVQAQIKAEQLLNDNELK